MNKTNPMILLEEHAIDNVQMDTSLIIQIQQIYYVASVKVHVEHVLEEQINVFHVMAYGLIKGHK